MSRNRRRFVDSMFHSTPYLAAIVVSILFVSSWISNIDAASPPRHATSGESSYLYNTEDSAPVLDHGLLSSGYDFTRSTSPKVVEFYDPKCGACQAFRANYVETARKVRARKPSVEFYGVSCEVHPILCDSYGAGTTVPRILAFPDGSDNTPATGGIEVPKGAGTIYFLSARLMKALRTPEEIASDGVELAKLETPKRRLMGEDDGPDEDGEVASGGEDEDEDEDDLSEDHDATQPSEDENSASEDGVASIESIDQGASIASGDQDGSFSKISMDEDDERPSVEVEESEDPSERRYDRVRERESAKSESRDKPRDRTVNQIKRDEQHGPSSANGEYRGKRGIPPVKHNTRQRSEGSEDREGASRNQAYVDKPVSRPGMGNGKAEKQRSEENEDREGASIKQAFRGEPVSRPDMDNKGFKMKRFTAPSNTCFKESQCDAKRKQLHVPDSAYHVGRFEVYGCFQEEGKGIFWGRGASSTSLNAVRLNGGRERVWCEGEISDNQKVSPGRYEDAVLEENYMAQNGRDEQNPGDVKTEELPNEDAEISVANGRPDDQQAKREKREKEHEQTDAYKNTMKHFEALDLKRGKEIGYHYRNYKEERDAMMRKYTQDPPRSVPRSREGGDPRQEEHASEEKAPAKKPPFRSDPQHSGQSPYSGPIPIVNIRENERQKEGEDRGIPPPPPRQHLPVGGDIFAPNPFSTDPVRAKKFQEYVARRKEMLERNEKLKHPIKAILGKDGEKKEEEDSAILMHKKKSGVPNTASITRQKKGAPDLRPEAQKHTVGEKVLKKIPIVKRAFKRSKGEELLNDAALSFTRGMIMGVFKSNEALDYKKKSALLDWFDLLRVSLPPEIGLHELIDTLKYNIDTISQRSENLVMIIKKHPLPDSTWSDSCTKGAKSGGFFCGFWKLLHVMSVGFAEQAGGLALQESSPSIRVFSAKEAGDVVREYMALFFNCDKCSKRFVAQYDDCSFQRCHRLSDETVDAPAESWQEFPLWLWQAHNDVSRSKSNRASNFNEDIGRKAEARKWERDMQAVYPHIDQCITCVTGEGIWDLNAVYNHLEKEYWEFGHEIDPKLDKFLEYNDVERKTTSHGLGAYVLISLIMLLGLAAKKHRIRVTGRHKKAETFSFGRTSKKYRDS